jgi:hypothetical protein
MFLFWLALALTGCFSSANANELPPENRERKTVTRSKDQEILELTAENAWDDQADAKIARLADAIGRMHGNDPITVDRYTALTPLRRPERQDPIAPGAMTVLSMAMAIGALGVLIRNQPARVSDVSSVAATSEAWRTLVRCVCVLVVLNIFDLTCTLLAVRTGGLLELNPMAEELTHHPFWLVVFKLTVLGAVAAVLLRFWQYRLAQLASWWGSALYAVLAIRWATYSSLFLY